MSNEVVKLRSEIIELLDVVKNETGADKFVFLLKEELDKLGIVDEEVDFLYNLVYEILNNSIEKVYKLGIVDEGVDFLNNSIEKVYKKYVGNFLEENE